MADHEEGVQLFGQCKICIVCSKDFDEDAANQVRNIMRIFSIADMDIVPAGPN